MIFKTFDNDIDNWSAKIGVFGKSINDFTEAYAKRKAAIGKSKNKKETKQEVGSFWSYLSKPKKEDPKFITNKNTEIVSSQNIDSYIKKLTPDSANAKLKEILRWQGIANSKKDKRNWHDYYKQLLADGDGYLIGLIKNTDNLSQLTGEDLVKANDEARQSTIEHNKALKEQSLGAKASKFALNALATVGNMAFDMLVSAGINAAIEAWDNYANAQENAIERGNEAFDRMQQNQAKIANAQSVFDSIKSNTVISDDGREITRFEQLSMGVSSLGENISLTKAEFEEYNSILEQLSGAGLTATTSMSALEEQMKNLRTETNRDTLKGLGDWVDGFNAKNNQMANDSTKEIGYQQKINALDKIYKNEDNGFQAQNVKKLSWWEELGGNYAANMQMQAAAQQFNSDASRMLTESAQEISNETLQLATDTEALEEIAKEFNIDIFDENGEFSYEKYSSDEVQKQLADARKTLMSEVESEVRQGAGYLQALFENSDGFGKLSETTANMVSGIFNNIDYDTVSEHMIDKETGKLDKDMMESWVNDLADNLANMDIQEQFNELFTLDSKKDKMTYSEYKRQSEGLIEFISGKVPQLSKSLLRKSSGLDNT